MRSKATIAIVLALACAGVAIAANSSSGALHACASKRTGAMRLLKHGKCKHSEREVSWNAAGKTGPRGASGQPGAAGVTGAAGTARGYAYVLATGPGSPKLDTTRTKGFTAVAYSSGGAADGTYCLTPTAGVDPADSVPVVSPVYQDADAGQVTLAFPDLGDADCPAGDFDVQTFILSAGSQTPDHTISFDIVVP